jgi:hypothetical protein
MMLVSSPWWIADAEQEVAEGVDNPPQRHLEYSETFGTTLPCSRVYVGWVALYALLNRLKCEAYVFERQRFSASVTAYTRNIARDVRILCPTAQSYAREALLV